uniref:Uncharacterized protein n=1 Tax=Arundo donax TaxID=35708 RepID=A0A0A8ZNU4_ARUDO
MQVSASKSRATHQ